ncbi:unnamed protein product [Dicrocoelium dendriticum]|nr:unnamed protein product [Dicrocoelium dendriticum]
MRKTLHFKVAKQSPERLRVNASLSNAVWHLGELSEIRVKSSAHSKSRNRLPGSGSTPSELCSANSTFMTSSIVHVKRKDDNVHLCLIPLEILNGRDRSPLALTA